MLIRNLIVTVLLLPFVAMAGLDFILEPVPLHPAEPPAEVQQEPEPVATAQAKVKTVTVTKEAVAQKLAEAMADRGELQGTLEVTLQRNWQPLKLAGEEWTLVLDKVSNQKIVSYAVVEFSIQSDASKAKKFSMPIRCQLWRAAWVAREALDDGVALNPENFGQRRVDVLSVGKELLAEDADLALYETVRTVRAGDYLEMSDVQMIPLVRKGDVVEVVAEEGLLRITMKAMALEDGARGTFIKVRNLQSRKDIQVEVINEKAARVHF